MSHLETAKEAIIEQSKALKILANYIPKDFSSLIDYIMKFKGRVILIGMGKSSYIAKKIAASLASTGTPAFFVIGPDNKITKISGAQPFERFQQVFENELGKIP